MFSIIFLYRVSHCHRRLKNLTKNLIISTFIQECGKYVECNFCVRIWERTSIIFLYNFNCSGFIMEKALVYYAVRSGSELCSELHYIITESANRNRRVSWKCECLKQRKRPSPTQKVKAFKIGGFHSNKSFKLLNCRYSFKWAGRCLICITKIGLTEDMWAAYCTVYMQTTKHVNM
jgi:hypothetical protein